MKQTFDVNHVTGVDSLITGRSLMKREQFLSYAIKYVSLHNQWSSETLRSTLE